jgi:iron complex outermembrane recepter protein
VKRKNGELLISARLAVSVRSVSIAAASLLLLVSRANAIEEASAAEQDSGTALQEIVVTAQKRKQSVNDVGMGITALSNKRLLELGINDTQDLTKAVPGFTFAQSQKASPIYTIRGVGYYDDSLAASPAVTVYTDEVGYPFPIMSRAATLDIERVEVLKGPQGTLFGQNSTGGAINFIAAKPTDTLQYGGDLSYGRFNATSVDAFISGPLTNTLQARLAISDDEGGAWQRSYTRGDYLGSSQIHKARLLLDWIPTDALKVAVNLNGWSDHSDTLAAALLAVIPQDPVVFPAETRQIIAPNRAGTADWSPGVPRKEREDFYQGSIRVDYTASDQVGITSISSYEHFAENDGRDVDGSALDVYHLSLTGSIRSYSEELRAHGQLLDNRLLWLVGAEYSDDDTHELNTEFLTDDSLALAFTAFGLPPFTGVTQLANNDVRTSAGFGNLEFHPIDPLTLHAGARFTQSNTTFNGCSQTIDAPLSEGITGVADLVRSAVGLPPITPIAVGGCTTLNAALEPGLIFGRLDQNNVSWRTGIDWKAAPGTLFYGTVSKGYKAGSFPTVGAPSYIQYVPATQESVLAEELGVKTDFGISSVHVDAAIFNYDYRNKQFRARTIDPLGIFGAVESLINIPKSYVRGAELSATWRVISDLTLSASATYLDSKVTNDFENYDPIGNPVNFKGEAFPFTPKWLLQFGPYFQRSIAANINGFASINYDYNTSTTSAFGNNGLFNVASYGLIDAQLGVNSADGRWRAALWGKNIANKYYWTDVFRESDNVSRHVGMPATFGIKLSYRTE